MCAVHCPGGSLDVKLKETEQVEEKASNYFMLDLLILTHVLIK